MAKHNRQAAEKRARNDAYAALFPRRSRKARRDARRERTRIREMRWLELHGIEFERPRNVLGVMRGRRSRR